MAAFLLLLPGPAEASSPPPFQAGAARVDTTPPLFDAAADAAAFPNCPPAFFSGPRVFSLSEPYADIDASGEFNYSGVGQSAVPEPFCDANLNGRYDGIYDSGGVDQLARSVHDPIDARAIAISSGQKTVVIVSVVAQGVFENYVRDMRRRAAELRPGITDLIVSANHNESSPDTVGIYGGPEVAGVTGANSGIDEYYMDYLVERVAQAAAEAYDERIVADLAVAEFRLPGSIDVRLSKNFPTTDDAGQPAAIDPKVRILTATDPEGQRIFTTMNLAVHNQEIGHSDDLGRELSSDWPGYFHDRLEELAGGRAMFLAGDNGSQEDPVTDPPVDPATHPECDDGGCYAQAQATGEALAEVVADHLANVEPLRKGRVRTRREVFFAPLENNLFKAAAAAGLFGERQTFQNGVPAGRAGNELRTEVDTVSIGPDLQLLTNPGEAFPALMVGSPWGIEEVGCPERPDPPVPAWHASAPHRFEVGLANDLIGYELPAWAYSSAPGAFRYSGPPDFGGPATCVNDADDKDPKGHQHKLETEGAGPTASNLVARNLARLLDMDPDPSARIRHGRFLYRDGSTSRRASLPTEGKGKRAVAIWLADPGDDALKQGEGTIVALAPIGAFGARSVDAAGDFIDYDGAAQHDPDLTTRGMLARGAAASGGAKNGRYYVDVYPELKVAKLGQALAYCDDSGAPRSRIERGSLRVRPHRLRVGGVAQDAGCRRAGRASRPGEVDSVAVDISRRLGKRGCQFVGPKGRLTHRVRPCREPIELPAQGSADWRLAIRVKRLPPGRYRVRSRATDRFGNVEGPGGKRRAHNIVPFRVR